MATVLIASPLKHQHMSERHASRMFWMLWMRGHASRAKMRRIHEPRKGIEHNELMPLVTSVAIGVANRLATCSCGGELICSHLRLRGR